MKKVLREYIEVEYPEKDQEKEYQKMLLSPNKHYHWCTKCSMPQFIPSKVSCSETMERNKVITCPHCNPENFIHTCPQCKGKIYVNHGCSQVRHCAYGERCGASRTKTKLIMGSEWEVPDPVPCDHGGGCGCIFNINPKPNDLSELRMSSSFTTRQLKKTLQCIHGSPYLLLEYYTRHDPGCTCPCCNEQPSPPIEFSTMRKHQVQKLQEEVIRGFSQ